MRSHKGSLNAHAASDASRSILLSALDLDRRREGALPAANTALPPLRLGSQQAQNPIDLRRLIGYHGINGFDGDLMDVYFSADVETDGPIPGEYSMLSFALVPLGTYDGKHFRKNISEKFIYKEIKPISEKFQNEALAINGLDRNVLRNKGDTPEDAMNAAYDFVDQESGSGSPVLVAYPLSFDWSFLYWYFTKYAEKGSPFGHSRCLDIKTMWSVKSGIPISQSGRSKIPERFQSTRKNTHHAIADAIAQGEMFLNIFEWDRT